MMRLLRSSDPSFASLSEIVPEDEGEDGRPILCELERSSVVYSLEMYQLVMLCPTSLVTKKLYLHRL